MNPIPTPRCCARVAKAFNGRNAAEVAKRFHLTECMVITIAQYHAALQEALRQLDAKDAEIAAIKTRAQFRQELAEKGLSANAWARQHGYSTASVSAILNDDERNPRIRCLRGEAHKIAVSMGLKRDARGTPMDDEMLGGAATRKNGKRLMTPAQLQRLAGLSGRPLLPPPSDTASGEGFEPLRNECGYILGDRSPERAQAIAADIRRRMATEHNYADLPVGPQPELELS